MPKIEHFNIPADNVQRAKKFYENLFNWKIEKVSGDMEYYEVTTEKGALAGGMGQRQADQKITNYVGVNDIDKYINSVRKYGGKITTPKMEVPGHGWLAIFEDTEGNILGLWQEN